MIKAEIVGRKGFEILHNSEEWRLAIHAYDSKVNGIPSFRSWGRHMDSEEAFLLLEGKGWLVVADDEQNWSYAPLTREEIQIVEKAERHAILLEEGSSVLIIENRDMTNSVTEEIGDEMVCEILYKINIKNKIDLEKT